jgi:uncharacterized membrane protein
LARLLSYLLHPLLMPALTLWLALELDPYLGYFLDDHGRRVVLGMVALMTIAFPLVSALLLLRAGVISSLEMPGRRERIAPFAMTLLYYGMAWYLLLRSPLHPMAVALFSGAVIAVLVAAVVTPWWKISAHMVGIGGCLGAIVSLSIMHHLDAFGAIALLLVLAGALGTARLFASDHTPAQVYAGVAVGFICVFGTIAWLPSAG